MEVWQSESGRWYLSYPGGAIEFSTAQEATNMVRKLDFAEAVRAKITEFDNLVTYMNELNDIFQDSGYAATGGDPITDTDLEALEMTAANLAAFSIFVENVNLFLENGEPLQFDYAAAINKFRNM